MAVVEDTSEKEKRELAVTKYKGAKRLEIVGDYLSRKILVNELGSGNVTIWHKPISEMIGEAAKAGFLVEQVIEPRPLKKMKTVSESHYDVLNKIPEFLIIRLWKPNSTWTHRYEN